MANDAVLKLEGKEFPLPTMVGSEGEKAIDVRNLRAQTGYITYDDGFGNTGSCTSGITFIDGDAGILRYRGYPIEQLAEHSSFVETAYLIIHGELPNAKQRRACPYAVPNDDPCCDRSRLSARASNGRIAYGNEIGAWAQYTNARNRCYGSNGQ